MLSIRASRSSAAAVFIVLTLLSSPANSGSGVAVRAGDRVTYDYTQTLVEPLPNGTTYRQAYVSRLTLDVLSVSNSGIPVSVDYTLGYTTYHNVTVTQTSSQGSLNSTYLFDPYDNETYLGALGFFPFIYTDVAAGSRANMEVTVLITQAPNGTIMGTSRVNVTVARAGPFISVNFTAKAGSKVQPSDTILRFNATTGVLNYGFTRVNLLSLERDFIFTLVSYEPGPTPHIPLIAFVIFGAFGALLAVALVDRAGLLGRASRQKGKVWKRR